MRKVSVGQPPSSSSEGQSLYCQSTISLWKDKTAICNTEELGVLWGGEELICLGSQLPARLSLRTWVHCHPLQPGLLTHSKLQENQTCHAENNSIRDENGKKTIIILVKVSNRNLWNLFLPTVHPSEAVTHLSLRAYVLSFQCWI